MPTDNPHVKTNYKIRAGSFVMGFAILVAHLANKNYAPLTWGLLVLQFLVYPHLLYWHASRAKDPLRIELGNLLLDPFLFGLWCGALGFPLWISFALFACALVNIIFHRGTRGAVDVALVFALGGLVGLALMGWQLNLNTNGLVTALCIIGLTLYFLVTINAAFARNQKLRDIRARLLRSEDASRAANEALESQLQEIHALQAQLREQAHRDPLTGLYNRRYFDNALEREWMQSKREGQPLSLVLIDIDFFKQINDTYGHPAGDEVLKQMAAQLDEQTRASDVVCRYGGEEFLVLLPGMSQADALERSEQWRTRFVSTVMVFGELRIQATISIGIAAYPGHGTSAQALIRSADHALYCAKNEGRNCVRVFSAAPPEAEPTSWPSLLPDDSCD